MDINPRGPARPGAERVVTQAEKALLAELDRLIEIDRERAQLDQRQAELNGDRAKQLGRMEVFAEQADIDLQEFVGQQLADGRADVVAAKLEGKPAPRKRVARKAPAKK